ncbi:alpha/beta hydrolase [Rhodococcus sp. 05-340-1]|uniref:alpha/beta fold hydrolase n=1 Tax=Nocardiaceae TaxID=85025 RepID=UPI00068E4C87|nr:MULTISPECIES: alpha/beta hydrolase [Rhodococcus]OZC87734.1 alpha/beta hydrolase [Rhodococcus sp. 06-412-2C]OZC96385.1 alpha/beta hydrolase [Rhodococcus sp. 06-412-2B]OZD65369.1 alpha/beta hydrolase [Rhodococcus sp. 05-340-2]OZD74585.1 alpha/beta hydrolase [Rhodococcus sp. 05-340-1]OZD86643.1 alpha/beta hydrolase [Rhodococcus sp. 05-339-2]
MLSNDERVGRISSYARVRGTGTPVLLLHGFTIDHRMMLPLDRHFSDRESERHYLDLPGSGRSPRLKTMSSGGIVETVSKYIDTYFGDQDFALVGASYGGFLARALHVRYRSRVLGSFLIAPAVRSAEHRTLSADVAVVERDNFELDVDESDRVFLDSFRAISPRHTRASWSEYHHHVVPGYRAHDRDAAQELLLHYNVEPVPEESLTSPLGGINVVITGKQDSVVGWRDQLALVDYYDRHTYVALDGAGHNVHLDQPLLVGALLEAWLSELSLAHSADGCP